MPSYTTDIEIFATARRTSMISRVEAFLRNIMQQHNPYNLTYLLFIFVGMNLIQLVIFLVLIFVIGVISLIPYSGISPAEVRKFVLEIPLSIVWWRQDRDSQLVSMLISGLSTIVWALINPISHLLEYKHPQKIDHLDGMVDRLVETLNQFEALANLYVSELEKDNLEIEPTKIVRQEVLEKLERLKRIATISGLTSKRMRDSTQPPSRKLGHEDGSVKNQCLLNPTES